MKRTKLDDRVLPNYTRGEEIFNMVTHIVGGAFGIAVLVLCIVFGAIRDNGYGIVSDHCHGGCIHCRAVFEKYALTDGGNVQDGRYGYFQPLY